MSASHSFNIYYAQEFGIQEAIIINHFQHWIGINKRNKINNYEGRTWSYQTIKYIADHFIYLSFKQVRNVLDSLIEQGVLIKANFNDHKYDRTSWYAFKDEARFFPDFRDNCTNGQMEKSKWANGFDQKGTPIPDTIPDTITNTTTPTPSKGLESCGSFTYKNETKEAMKELGLTDVQVDRIEHKFPEEHAEHAIRYCKKVKPKKDLMSQFFWACNALPDIPLDESELSACATRNKQKAEALQSCDTIQYQVNAKELFVYIPSTKMSRAQFTDISYEQEERDFDAEVEKWEHLSKSQSIEDMIRMQKILGNN